MRVRTLIIYAVSAAFVVAWVMVAPGLKQSAFPRQSTVTQPAARPVPDFALTDQHTNLVTCASLLGKVWVADFIFSSCPGACLELTKRMGEIERSLPAGDDIRVVSFSIDPRNDTPAALAAYAKANTAGPRWLFLTGERRITARVANDGFLFALSPDPNSFDHSERIAVVDATGMVRGWFDSGASDLVPAVCALVKELQGKGGDR